LLPARACASPDVTCSACVSVSGDCVSSRHTERQILHEAVLSDRHTATLLCVGTLPTIWSSLHMVCRVDTPCTGPDETSLRWADLEGSRRTSGDPATKVAAQRLELPTLVFCRAGSFRSVNLSNVTAAPQFESLAASPSGSKKRRVSARHTTQPEPCTHHSFRFKPRFRVVPIRTNRVTGA
jgi:hypothetical protein